MMLERINRFKNREIKARDLEPLDLNLFYNFF